MPLPVPLAVTPVIHESTVVAVHAQPGAVVTETLEEPPAAEGEALFEPSTTTQPLAWLSVKVCPPAAIVPTRAGPTLAAKE